MKPEEFVTSDYHFGHDNIRSYSNRPFSSVEEMETELIRRWNEKVPKKARVYFLGDMFMGSSRRQIPEILDQLHGRICFIRGNHDKVIKGDICKRFEWIKDYYESKTSDGIKVVMCHYAFRVWNMSHHGSWNLHGHSHGSLQNLGNRQIDVGVDTHPNYEPYSFDEISAIMESRSHRAVDHHT